jgi:cytochrome P450
MTDTIEPTISEPLALSDSPENAIAWERVPYNAADYGPVSDFATDFDHADKSYNANAPEVWQELRDSGCPVAHSDRYGGMWTPITHEAVHDVAYDTENFTSRSVVVSHARPGDAAIPAPIGVVPPISSDPPFHNLARRLLLPPFAPKQIEPWEDEIRALCTRLLDEMGDITPGDTVVDAAIQYAQHIPVNVIGRMLGFPEADEALFREFVHNTLETINAPTADRQENFQKL